MYKIVEEIAFIKQNIMILLTLTITYMGGRYDTKEAMVFRIQNVVCSKSFGDILKSSNIGLWKNFGSEW